MNVSISLGEEQYINLGKQRPGERVENAFHTMV